VDKPGFDRAFVTMTEGLIQRHFEETKLYILGDFYEAWIGCDFSKGME